jgi:hypothetical protein
MATCPQCGEYLGEHHACRGRAQRWRRTAIAVATGALVGLFGPFVVFAGYHAQPVSLVAMTVLGAVAGGATWRAVSK